MTRTVLFIHGAWLTPASWDEFRAEFEKRGYQTVAPAWPYMDGSVMELRAHPAPELNHLGIAEIVDHYARIADALPEPPILVGHSFGGLIAELLLDRSIGVAGVAIDPAPPRGVFATPRAVLTSLPVFASWRGWRRTHTMSEKGFRTGLANGLTPEEQAKRYAEQIVPAPGRIFYEGAFGLGTKLHYDNPKRAPLLLIGGADDRTVPIGMVRSNYKKSRRSSSPTDFIEYPGRGHFQMAQDGWEQVADNIIAWIQKMVPADEPAKRARATKRKQPVPVDLPSTVPLDGGMAASESAGPG
jgi:pimeloyl-ACP methyl ester carboxylesterase